MKTQFEFRNKIFEIIFWVILGIIFMIIVNGFTYSYSGNQTTKFLFGLAKGGFGNLSNDWFANTIDPLPVFSFLVHITYQYLNEFFFQIYHLILLSVFLYSAVQIADHFFQIRRNKLLFFGFTGIFISTFSKLWIPVYKYLYSGIALQDIAVSTFLPNIFAAFLFLSIALFLKNKYIPSIISLALAGTFHSGYLIIGAVLVFSYIVIEYFETKNLRRVLLIGLFALLLVSPIVIYTLQPNTDSTSEQVHTATRIVVEERIPHHTQITVFWGMTTIIKMILALTAIFIMWKSKYLPLFIIAFLVTFVPILVLYIRSSNTIALLQIWRVSVLLAPLSSIVILGSLISFIYSKFGNFLEQYKRIVYLLIGAVLTITVIFGISKEINELKYYQNRPENQLYNHIRQTLQNDDLYLIDPLRAELFDFRTKIGAPILVNWKSHPWNTLEILEWYERINIAKSLYETEDNLSCENLFPIIDNYPITHVVTLADKSLNCSNLQLSFQDEHYLLYQIISE